MRTKTIKDSNLIKIIFDKVPQTGTLSKLSEGLNLLDTSVNAICDARITEALDTSSIQTLWDRFREFDFVTAAALSDLDYRINVTDSSLGVFNSQNLTKFDEVNSSLSDLSNAIVDVSNALQRHIIDTSNISGSVKPEDIEQYLQPLRNDITNVSTNLYSQTVALDSAIVGNTTLIQNVSSNLTVTRSILTDVSTRLSNHLNDSDTTNSSLNSLTNLVTAIDSLQTEQTTAINNINASISALVVSTVNNTSIWNNQAAPNIRALNTSVNDISTRLANHINEYVNINPSTIENLTTAVNQINTSLGLNGYFDHIRDVSINTLTEYVHTTVDSLLTSYTQRLNSTESIAVDAMAVANDVSTHFSVISSNVNYIVDNFNSSIYARFDEIDSSINNTIDEKFAVINSSLADFQTTLNNSFDDYTDTTNTYITNFTDSVNDTMSNYQTNINSSFADYQDNINNSFSNYQTNINSSFVDYKDYIDSSLIGWGNILEERDFVISRALTQLDTSIVWLINRLTALQQS